MLCSEVSELWGKMLHSIYIHEHGDRKVPSNLVDLACRESCPPTSVSMVSELAENPRPAAHLFVECCGTVSTQYSKQDLRNVGAN